MIAARLALRLGNRLDRLVLIAPAGPGARMAAGFPGLRAHAETTAPARALARLGPGAGPYSKAALGAEPARLRSRREGMLARGRAAPGAGGQQTDIAPMLDPVQARVTAVFGLDRPIIDWRDCASLPPRAAIHLRRGARHLPHAARPDLVAELVLGRGRGEGPG